MAPEDTVVAGAEPDDGAAGVVAAVEPAATNRLSTDTVRAPTWFDDAATGVCTRQAATSGVDNTHAGRLTNRNRDAKSPP